MRSSHVLKQDYQKVETDTSSLFALIERGIACLEQGRHVEGAGVFKLAYQQLLPEQIQLSSELDALTQVMERYLHAQEELHEASKRFTATALEQQVQMEALKKQLSMLAEVHPAASASEIQHRHIGGDYLPLRLLRSSTADAAYSVERQLPAQEERRTALPPLFITCFGHFEVRRADPSSSPLRLCANLKGQAILRYLISQRKRRETVEKLLAELWPEESPETAQHKLRVAISALRCSLNKDLLSETGGGYILCHDQSYLLNPSVAIQSDVDEFLRLYQAGRDASDAEAARLFERACRIYSGPYMGEDLYAEWSFMRREELSKIYSAMCDRLAEFNLQTGRYEEAVKWASAMLEVDRCDEEAHRQLMRAYAYQGRRSEALRQFQQCQRVLGEELGVPPMPETLELLDALLQGKSAPGAKRS